MEEVSKDIKKMCKNCIHWESTHFYKKKEYGDCRISTPTKDEHGYTYYDETSVNHWCERWEEIDIEELEEIGSYD